MSDKAKTAGSSQVKQIVRHCEKCKHMRWVDPGFELECKIGHRTRFHTPKSPRDTDWGWKRKCSDFEAMHNAKGDSG